MQPRQPTQQLSSMETTAANERSKGNYYKTAKKE
jgi:hypothetical protein